MLKFFLTEDDLEVGDIIEKSAYETVAECKVKNTDHVFCYKKIGISSETMHTRQQRSKLASLTLINPSIVKYYQVIEENDYIIFLSEYSPLGNLEKEIASREKSKPKNYWSEDELLDIWKRMVHACAYLETYSCAHRDIRPSNFIKFSENSYKLTNFLYVYDKFNRETNHESDQLRNNERIVQSIAIGRKRVKIYLSPEQLSMIYESNAGYNPFKSDVYCLGKIFLQMACLGDFANDQGVINDLQYSNNIKRILEAMLNQNPKLRPSFKTILYEYLSINLNYQILPAKAEEIKLMKIDREEGEKIIGEKRKCKSGKEEIKKKEKKETEEEIKNNEAERRITSKFKELQEMKKPAENPLFLKPIQQEENKEPIYEITSFDQIELQEQINDNYYLPEVEIYKCLIRSSNTQASVKIYGSLDHLLPTAEFEANVYKKLNRNKAFLEFYGSFRHEDKYYIVLEYIPNDLTSFINSSEKVKEEILRKFLEDLVAGLIDLKNLGFVHGDIKPENILLDDFKPKIIDFGSSRIYPQETHENIKIKGTPKYLDPELWRCLALGESVASYDVLQADLYSLGITILDFIRQKDHSATNADSDSARLQKYIKKIKIGWAKDLVKQLTKYNPSERLTLEASFDLIKRNSKLSIP